MYRKKSFPVGFLVFVKKIEFFLLIKFKDLKHERDLQIKAKITLLQNVKIFQSISCKLQKKILNSDSSYMNDLLFLRFSQRILNSIHSIEILIT